MHVEPVHAVTYFAPEVAEALAAAGLQGWWRGYFAARAAPLGPVGVDGCEANQLAVVDAAVPAERQQIVRGWSDDEWAAAGARARARPAGFRAAIEARTDVLAHAPVDALGPAGLEALCAGLLPIVTALVDSGTIGYPNPVGVPPVS